MMVFTLITVTAMYLFAVAFIDKDIPPSFSDGFYILDEEQKDLGYMFTLWAFINSFGGAIFMIQYTEGLWYLFISFLAPAMLAFVGAAPLFKSIDKKVHVYSAFASAIIFIIWLLLTGNIFILFLYGLLVLYPLIKTKKYIFFGELILFLSVYTVMFLNR